MMGEGLGSGPGVGGGGVTEAHPRPSISCALESCCNSRIADPRGRYILHQTIQRASCAGGSLLVGRDHALDATEGGGKPDKSHSPLGRPGFEDMDPLRFPPSEPLAALQCLQRLAVPASVGRYHLLSPPRVELGTLPISLVGEARRHIASGFCRALPVSLDFAPANR